MAEMTGRNIGEGGQLPVVADDDAPSGALIAQRFTLRELTNVAKAVAASKMFAGVDTETKAFTLMLLADSMGLHPMTAMRQFDILPNGKPAMKSEALLAQHVAAGGGYKVTERSNKRAAGVFTFKNVTVEAEFTEEDAEAAGLMGKDNYKKYRSDMFFWRMVARGVRSSGSGVGVGIITIEEAQDVVIRDVPTTSVDVDTPGRRSFGKSAIKPPVVEPVKPVDEPVATKDAVPTPNPALAKFNEAISDLFTGRKPTTSRAIVDAHLAEWNRKAGNKEPKTLDKLTEAELEELFGAVKAVAGQK